MALNFPLPYLVNTDMAINYDTANVKQMQQHMFQVSIKLEDALRNEGRLCGLIGHTVIGRYELKGDFETVLANMIYFRLDLMSTEWKRDELYNLADIMGKRCTKFVRETFYNTPAMVEANKLHSVLDSNNDYMVVLENYQLHLHNSKQCLCHCN